MRNLLSIVIFLGLAGIFIPAVQASGNSGCYHQSSSCYRDFDNPHQRNHPHYYKSPYGYLKKGYYPARADGIYAGRDGYYGSSSGHKDRNDGYFRAYDRQRAYRHKGGYKYTYDHDHPYDDGYDGCGDHCNGK